MKSLDGTLRARIKEYAEAMATNAAAVAEVHARVTAQIEAAFPELAAAVEAYNETVGVYNELIDEAQDAIAAYVERKSAAWREGEEADAYQAWTDAIDEARAEEADDPDMPEIDLPDCTVPDPLPPFRLSDVAG